MRVSTINYKKIFPGEIQFTNTTLGVEIEVNENENANDAFDLAKKTVDEWMNPKPKNGYVKPVIHEVESIPVINRQEEKMSIAIENTTTLEELEKLKPNLPVSLSDQFQTQLDYLTNKAKSTH